MKTVELKNLEELLIQIGLKIAKRGEGALFVVGNAKYKPLVDQDVPPFNVLDNPKLLESLALMDGAIILTKTGKLKSYAAMIHNTKTFKNFGTRHSAAISASQTADLVVLVSEEDKKVRILKKGKMIMQIDAMQKNIEKSVPHAVDILESIGAGTLGSVGASLLVPTLGGIAGVFFLPGIVVFGAGYYLTKNLQRRFGRT